MYSELVCEMPTVTAVEIDQFGAVAGMSLASEHLSFG